MKPRIFPVSEVTQYLKDKLEKDEHLANLGVRGEISNFKHHNSGHMYFTLKDKKSTLRCVMFRHQNRRLNFSPRDGLRVVALGSICVYARDGIYQLYVEAMEPAGVGSLHLAFEELKNKLEQEGLFGAERKKQLPLLPRKVGIITSPTGAAIKDIINVSRRRFPNMDLLVAPAMVQGEKAVPQMVAALSALTRVPGVDVIILGRGGGSWEELWAFNDETLARAVAACPVPVVAAIGHESDFTIIDFVADVRAPTPSAAAELVVPSREELVHCLQALGTRSLQGIRKVLKQDRQILLGLTRRRPFAVPGAIFSDKRQLLDARSKDLERTISHRLQDWRTRVSLQGGRLNSLSPLAVLQRGYSVALDEKGRVIKEAGEVPIGMRLRVILAQGQLGCQVEEVEEGKTGE